MRYNNNSSCGKWNKAKTKKSCVPKARKKKTKASTPYVVKEQDGLGSGEKYAPTAAEWG
jgi:hypothetical protein